MRSRRITSGFAVLSFFQRFKFKIKDNNEDIEDENDIYFKKDLPDKIINENDKEWESFNF